MNFLVLLLNSQKRAGERNLGEIMNKSDKLQQPMQTTIWSLQHSAIDPIVYYHSLSFHTAIEKAKAPSAMRKEVALQGLPSQFVEGNSFESTIDPRYYGYL